MGRDQPDNAARVVAAGAGVALKPSAKVAAIRAAVADVLATPSYTAAARRLAATIAAEGATDRAVAELEALARGARSGRRAMIEIGARGVNAARHGSL